MSLQSLITQKNQLEKELVEVTEARACDHESDERCSCRSRRKSSNLRPLTWRTRNRTATSSKDGTGKKGRWWNGRMLMIFSQVLPEHGSAARERAADEDQEPGQGVLPVFAICSQGDNLLNLDSLLTPADEQGEGDDEPVMNSTGTRKDVHKVALLAPPVLYR